MRAWIITCHEQSSLLPMSLPLEVLQERNRVLLELYRDHLQGIKELQERLIEERGKGNELYDDPWLSDTGN
jgi:hypothetical protein